MDRFFINLANQYTTMFIFHLSSYLTKSFYYQYFDLFFELSIYGIIKKIVSLLLSSKNDYTFEFQ